MKSENEEVLKRLDELKKQGMLTDKGFNTAKDRLEKDQEKGIVNNGVTDE